MGWVLVLLGCAGPHPMQAQVVSAVPSIVITLPDAIHRAEANEPNFAAARAGQRVAGLDRGIARAALLPGVVYNNSVLYTQPNGLRSSTGQLISAPPIVFEANNSVHEYVSQASITETAGLRGIAAVRLADAAAARATADLEIARRGLVAATANLFYGAAAAERRTAVLQGAKTEAADFVSLTEKREAAREAAHADVLKAELTLQGRTRDLTDAQLARDRARLELAVLLFTDPLTPYSLQLPDMPTLPALADVQAAAGQRNPDLAGAQAALRESNAQVLSAEAAYLPDVSLNFAYGIDAAQFARRGRITTETFGQTPLNLGYAITGTLNIPVWDWFATQRRIRQSEAQRDAVRVGLTATQRRLIVDLQESYAEARTSQSALASLELSVRTARESLQLTRLRYESGEATVLEVVDAQTTLYLAQTTQEDGQVRYQQALSNLQTLTGAL